jgi:hypothetical protein
MDCISNKPDGIRPPPIGSGGDAGPAQVTFCKGAAACTGDASSARITTAINPPMISFGCIIPSSSPRGRAFLSRERQWCNPFINKINITQCINANQYYLVVSDRVDSVTRDLISR